MPVIGASPVVVGPLPFPQSGYMPSAGNAPFLHRAIAQTIAGTFAADRKLLVMGDSIAAGSLANSPIGIVGMGPTLELVNYLNSEGTPAALGLSIAQANTSSGLSLDGRWVNGAGWTIPATGNGNGGLHNLWGGIGPCWQGANGAAGSLVFTPSAGTPNFDSYDIYSYWPAANSNGFTYSYAGGAGVALATGTGLVKTTVSGAAQSRPTLTFTLPGAFGALIVGVEPFLSTTRRLRVGNAGVLGTTSTQWLDNTNPNTGPIATLTQYAPDVVIYSMLWNDLNTGTAISTYQANIAAMLSAVKGIGADFILHIENPFLPTFQNGANQGAYAAAAIAFCRGAGIPYVDTYDAWGGAANFNTILATGYISGDNTIHPSVQGDYDIGRMMGQALIQI